MLPLTIHAQTKKINSLKVERTAMQKKINESEQLLNTTKKDVRSQLNNLLVLNTQIGEQQKYVEGILLIAPVLRVEKSTGLMI